MVEGLHVALSQIDCTIHLAVKKTIARLKPQEVTEIRNQFLIRHGNVSDYLAIQEVCLMIARAVSNQH